MERTVWTDERVDDAIARMDRTFARLDANFDRAWNEFGALRTEMRDMRNDMAASGRQLSQIGWALVGILLTQFMAAVIAVAMIGLS